MKSGGKLWTILRIAAVVDPGRRMIRPKRVARMTKVALDIPRLEPVRTSAATGAKQRRVEKSGQDGDNDNGGQEDAASGHWPLIATHQPDKIAPHAVDLLTW